MLMLVGDFTSALALMKVVDYLELEYYLIKRYLE